MNKPSKNTQYKIADNFTIQHYTNGSFAFFSNQAQRWVNIPKELGEKLYQLKNEIFTQDDMINCFNNARDTEFKHYKYLSASEYMNELKTK